MSISTRTARLERARTASTPDQPDEIWVVPVDPSPEGPVEGEPFLLWRRGDKPERKDVSRYV